MASDEIGAYKRLLYMSPFPPSGLSGAASIMSNLMRHYPPSDMWMLVEERAARTAAAFDQPCRMETVRWPDLSGLRQLARKSWPRNISTPSVKEAATTTDSSDAVGRLGWHLANAIVYSWIPVIASRATRMIRRENIEAILAVQGGAPFTIAAHEAHRRTGVPLYVFAMDEWLLNTTYPSLIHSLAGKFYEPRVIRDAAWLWGISPRMVEDWQERFGRRGEVLWHSVDVDSFQSVNRSPLGQAPTVTVLGTIYGVNAANFRSLVSAAADLREQVPALAGLRVRLRTTQDAALLRTDGAVPPFDWVDVAPLGEADVPQALADSDVLFLGLSFEASWARAVEVAFPTKLAEYLASGKPIIVFAPGYAAATAYVKGLDCGWVVDRPDESLLKKALLAALTDREAARSKADKALNVARLNHNRAELEAQFLRRFRRDAPQ